MPIRVAVDAMGGDHAPGVVVEGAVRAARALEQVQVHLFGPEAVLRPLVEAAEASNDPSVVVHDAPQVIGMAESPSAALKGKPLSSIHLGLGAHRAGEVDAFVSAGNTGAVMAASLFVLGRIPGVLRPTLSGIFPTNRSYALIVDVGTNVDCRPEHMVQFAQMGSIFAERILRRERPAVGLMNIGEEPGKGNEQAKAAYELLSALTDIHFVGNIEGRDVMRHAADVVVCDGFVGNIMLKLGESIASTLPGMVAEEMERQQLTAEEKAVVVRALGGVSRRFDYEEYGGVPLLGVAGNVIIGHGGSSAKAVEAMVREAAELVEQDVAGSIAAALGAHD